MTRSERTPSEVSCANARSRVAGFFMSRGASNVVVWVLEACAAAGTRSASALHSAAMMIEMRRMEKGTTV